MAGVRFDSRSIGLVCLVPLMCGSASYAGVIRVPADRPTIQSAINAARPGDEIVVAPGRYVELINFAGKAVTVRSVAGPQSTIIDAGGRAASAVSFVSGESAASRLEGFTIVGVRGTPQSRGSAIRIAQASPTIADCIITQNVGAPAGGATVAGGSPSFIDVRFVSNIGIEAGGLSVVGGDLDLTGLVFESNVGAAGGVFAAGSTLTISRSTFSRNGTGSGGGSGAGISLVGSAFDISRSTFVGNGTVESMPGGGQVFTTFAGGGVYAVQSRGVIDASRFVSNAAARGGGVYFRSTAEEDRILVTNTLFNRNDAGAASGAVYTAQQDAAFVNVTFVDNTGALFTDFEAEATISNSILFRNTFGSPAGQVSGNGMTRIAYSLVAAQASRSVTLGEGNITDRSPRFIDGNGLDNIAGTLDDDFRLANASAGVDAGRNDALPIGLSLDLAGESRFIDDPVVDDTGVGGGAIIDMGAFEFQPLARCRADFNRDGFVDWFDAELFFERFEEGSASADFDGDGFIDWFDLDAFLTAFDRGC